MRDNNPFIEFLLTIFGVLAFVGAIAFAEMLYSIEDPFPAYSEFVVSSAKVTSGTEPQQLYLRGLKGTRSAIGARVFLNPEKGENHTPQSKSYVASVFFSHRSDDENERQSFVITLQKPVSGEARVILYPISATNYQIPANFSVLDIEIKPADNKAFD